MDRETREHTIGGKSLVIKTYATARESQAIQSVYFANSKVDIQGESYKINDFNPAVRFEVEKEMVNQLVVSIDAKRESVADTILDTFRSDEYDELIKILNEITSKKK